MTPAAIEGTHKVWPRDSMRIRPHKVTLEFGNPLLPSPSRAAEEDPYQADTEELRKVIASMLNRRD